MYRLRPRILISFFCLVFSFAIGCAESASPDGKAPNNGGDLCEDLDSDGFLGKTADCPDGLDCNDRNPSVNPDAEEICGDGRDNNCSGSDEPCSTDCEDRDGDNFRDVACGGSDCNDNDANIRPRATEICGNGIDEDCDGQDAECNEECIDEDGDGFGAAGSVGCEGGDEVDCDDEDDTVFPGATEVCNEKDDDCDDVVDECALEGQICAGDRCQGGQGAECENQDQCAGMNLTCDTSTDPGICKGLDGASCTTPDDCASGLACEGDVCSGSFCDVNACDDANFPHCNEMMGQCSECPFWESQAVADAACSQPEQCAPGGWCAENWDVCNTSGGATCSPGEDLLSVSKALAACFVSDRPEKDMCYAFWIFNAVQQDITEDMLYDAYDQGDFDGLLTQEEDDALSDMWGYGFLNNKDLFWNEDLVVGSAKELCVWYEPGGFINSPELTVDRCANYAP